MNYTGLKEYLSKTIIALKEVLPENPFLNDKSELDLISGWIRLAPVPKHIIIFGWDYG